MNNTEDSTFARRKVHDSCFACTKIGMIDDDCNLCVLMYRKYKPFLKMDNSNTRGCSRWQ